MTRWLRPDSKVYAALLVALVLTVGSQTVALGQTVFFNPADNVPSEPEFLVYLDIDCLGEVVKGAEVKVSYDPLLLRLDAVTPGDWYTDSGQAFYFYDYTAIEPQGTIRFASAVLIGTLSGSGHLAVCHFTIRDFGISPLVFQDVDVRGAANTDLGFGHSTEDRIIVDPVVEVRVWEFGRLKAVYR